MSFLHPWAFAGFASLMVLVLLSLWRQRPVRVVVPSARLWAMIPDRLPPVRSLQRPRVGLFLILQMLVASALVFAMAGPGIVESRPSHRHLTVVVDGSVYMQPRLDAVKGELRRLDSNDVITYIDSATLRTRSREYWARGTSDGVVDPGPALDLAASLGNPILYVSDRAPSWHPPPSATLHVALVGGPLRNIGIVDATVRDGRLFLRLSQAAPVTVSMDGKRLELPPAAVHLVDVPAGATRIDVRIPADDFLLDDTVVVEKSAGKVTVAFEGRPDAAIRTAIESNPQARIVQGGRPQVLIRIGAPPDRATAPLVVDVDPAGGVESWSPPGTLSITPHKLTEGMEAEDLHFQQVGKLVGPVESPLLSDAGSPIAAVVRPGHVMLAARYASTGWPARPSFPIFWANVLNYSASAAGSWRITGLLDEAASHPGQVHQPFDPAVLGPRPFAPLRIDLTGAAIALAALFLGLLWFVERRGI